MSGGFLERCTFFERSIPSKEIGFKLRLLRMFAIMYAEYEYAVCL